METRDTDLLEMAKLEVCVRDPFLRFSSHAYVNTTETVTETKLMH